MAAEPELVSEGDSWRVGFGGRTVRVRDMKGVRDLAVLLARPGAEVHALELMGGADVGDAAGPALDEQARKAYQARIVERTAHQSALYKGFSFFGEASGFAVDILRSLALCDHAVVDKHPHQVAALLGQ